MSEFDVSEERHWSRLSCDSLEDGSVYVFDLYFIVEESRWLLIL